MKKTKSKANSKKTEKPGKKAGILLLAAFCAFLGALGQLFFKYGSAIVNSNILSWINLPVIAGVFLYGVATIAFILILRKAQLSILYPVIATSYVWVALLSIFVIGELINVFNWLGIALIVGGVTLTSIKKW